MPELYPAFAFVSVRGVSLSASFIRRLLICAVLVLGASACASERSPINRVQANALEKKFFVGEDLADPKDNPEFYYRPTIVDVDYGASQGSCLRQATRKPSLASASRSPKTCWVARLTYERIADTTGNGTPNSPDQNSGQIVAAFKIESHFDVKRSYNTSTGEELNIIEENSTDSPWYARAFMRVDWSQNLITSAYQLDTLSAMTAFDAVTYEARGLFRDESGRSGRAGVRRGERLLRHHEQAVRHSGEGVHALRLPAGLLPLARLFSAVAAPRATATRARVKVRLSFRRVVDHDYEPVHWDGARMDMFGMFTTGTLNPDRLGYDRDYGVVDDKWYRFVSRHNIWQRSHAQDAQGQPIECYTDKTTPVGELPSRDLVDSEAMPPRTARTTSARPRARARAAINSAINARCRMPSERSKPRRFNYAAESDPSLFAASAEALSQWDGALRQTAQTARLHECIRVNGGVTQAAIDKCKADYDVSLEGAVATQPQGVHALPHPVIADDDPRAALLGCSRAWVTSATT